ncbi:hypothetical protein GT347_00560 [Xylophilus rhododendri]|uniref:Uncharacterized protein n=1 Tax=Xylophilus rhododendri TaxID=2697032 RepID=A0A857J0A5_9BURK|nr:hypothetical protein [Xylophilus rhododendri]QHI96619.1 hypothetical protein GT347_00560 [Xylophilus rhododendri]
MKKQLSRFATVIVLAAAGMGLGTAAQAQPRPGPPHAAPHHAPKKHKVWVPAHREHGRMVRGHYVWR